MKNQAAQKRLLIAVRPIAAARRGRLEEMKRGRSGFKRADFVWHYLLQSFATMGRTSGALGLIKNQENYGRITYSALSKLGPKKREKVVQEVCRLAKVRMPERKAEYILRCFDHVDQMGGVEVAKEKLLAQRGAEAKIKFWRTFYGIGPKYARNIMMDVYHLSFVTISRSTCASNRFPSFLG
jgi:hypothetical protein